MSDARARAAEAEARGDVDGAVREYVAAAAFDEAARVLVIALRPLDAAMVLLGGIEMIGPDLEPGPRGRAQLAASLLREGGRDEHAKLVLSAIAGNGPPFPSAVLKNVLATPVVSEARVSVRPAAAPMGDARRSAPSQAAPVLGAARASGSGMASPFLRRASIAPAAPPAAAPSIAPTAAPSTAPPSTAPPSTAPPSTAPPSTAAPSTAPASAPLRTSPPPASSGAGSSTSSASRPAPTLATPTPSPVASPPPAARAPAAPTLVPPTSVAPTAAPAAAASAAAASAAPASAAAAPPRPAPSPAAAPTPSAALSGSRARPDLSLAKAPAEDRHRAEAGWRAAGEGAVEETIRQFLATGRKGAAARVALEAGQHARALEWFVELGLKYQAATCLNALGRKEEAFATFLEVPLDDTRYRRTCFDVVTLAKETGRLDFEVDRFLTAFVGEGPREASECDPFLELADLYAAAGFPVGAKRCAEGVLRVRPGDERAKALVQPPIASRPRSRPPVAHTGDVTKLPTLEEFTALARKHLPARPSPRR